MRFAASTFALALSLLTATASFAGSTGDRSAASPARLGEATAMATSAAMTRATELVEFNRLVVKSNLKNRLGRPTETYTVLAPSNEAVQKVPAGIRERMFVDGNPGLRQLVRRHMIAGAVDFSRLADGAELRTLSGEVLRVAKQADGTVLINGVYRVKGAGLATANGMIYTLDSMIAPTK